MTAPIMQPCRPGCPALVPAGTGPCPKHRSSEHRLDREQRGSARERGYDARWERYRLAYLREHPLCVECAAGVPLPRGAAPRTVTAATVVDHIWPHKGDPELFWDPANHRAVCKPHHDARVDEGDFGRPAPRAEGVGVAAEGVRADPRVSGTARLVSARNHEARTIRGTSYGVPPDGTGAPVGKT